MKILNEGYVSLVDIWGSEERIIEAARMSTAKGFQGWEPNPDIPGHKGDLKLLAFLWKNLHRTPFEMAGMTIEVKAPIFVFREWHRHRVPFSYNEMSARYIPLPHEDYVPMVENLVERSVLAATTSNRQAGGAGSRIISIDEARGWVFRLLSAYDYAQQVYEEGLQLGVPKELARLPVPVGRYSVMRASANLRGWLAFLALRLPSSAQWEIRQYAKAVAVLIQDAFPRTYQLFINEETQ